MTDSGDSLPLPAGKSSHFLKGTPLKQWWQISSRSANTNNPAIQNLLVFLLTLPFVASVAYGNCPVSGKGGFLVLTAFIWLSAALIFLRIAHRHLYHVLEVRASDEGLEFKSLFWKRKIRWLDISAFFPTGQREIARNKYVLETNNGDEFLLSKELTESAQLFDLIRQRMPRTNESFQYNHRALEGFLDSSMVMSFAIVLAFVFPILWSLLVASTQPDVNKILLAAAGILISGSILWFHISKIPETVRVGDRYLFLRTRLSAHTIPREQIISMKQVGSLLFLRWSQGWFMILTEKNEPITGKLIECKPTPPLLK